MFSDKTWFSTDVHIVIHISTAFSTQYIPKKCRESRRFSTPYPQNVENSPLHSGVDRI